MKRLLALLLLCAALSFGQVSSTPTLIDPTRFAARGLAVGNPFAFIRGGFMYLVLTEDQTGLMNGFVDIWRCALDGSTRTRMDMVGEPADALGTFVAYSAPSSSIISIAYNSQNTPTNQIRIATFDTATDTWGSSSSTLTISLAAGVLPFTQGNGAALLQKNNGDYYLYMIDPVAGTSRVGFYILSSGTWSAFTTISADECRFIFSVTRDQSTQEVHVYYFDRTAFFTAYVKIAANDVIGTPVILSDGTGQNADRFDTQIVGNNLATVYAESITGSPVLWQAMFLTTPLASFTPTVTQLWTDTDPGDHAYNGIIGVDGSGNINAFWVTTPGSTEKMMRSTQIAGVWSPPIVFYDQGANPPANTILDNRRPVTGQAVYTGSPSGCLLIPTSMLVLHDDMTYRNGGFLLVDGGCGATLCPPTPAPPVVVDVTGAPSPYTADNLLEGPHSLGGALYSLGESTGAGTTPPANTPVIYKSTDNGATWTDITGTSGVPGGFIYAWGDIVPNPQIITFAYDSGGLWRLKDFTLSTETWGSAYGTSGGPSTATNPLGRGALIVRLSNGTVKLFSGQSDGNVYYSIYDAGTVAWTTLNVQASVTPSAGEFYASLAAAVDTEDRVHFIYATATTGSPVFTDRVYRNLDVSNVLGTEFAFTPAAGSTPHSERIYVGSDSKVYMAEIGYAGGANNNIGIWVGTGLSNPSWVEQLVADVSLLGGGFGSHFVYPAESNGSQYVFFEVSDTALSGDPYYLYSSKYGGSSWSNQALYYDPNAYPPSGWTGMPGPHLDGLSLAACSIGQTGIGVMAYSRTETTGSTLLFLSGGCCPASGHKILHRASSN